MDVSKKLVSVAEAALILGLSRSLLYTLVMREEIPSIKIGRARRIPVGALDDFVSRQLARESRTPALG